MDFLSSIHINARKMRQVGPLKKLSASGVRFEPRQ